MEDNGTIINWDETALPEIARTMLEQAIATLNANDPEHEDFECKMSPECPCDDCQRENVKMD